MPKDKPMITLAPITQNHVLQLHRWKTNKELSKLIVSESISFTIKDIESWIRYVTNDLEQRTLGIYSDSDLIGIARLMFLTNENAELGIYIGDKKHRGHGYGCIAIEKLLEIAFAELRLELVYLKVLVKNYQAINCFKSCGFNEIGIPYKGMLLMEVKNKL